MTDLATLGLRVTSDEVVVADQRLDAFAASSGRAEAAAESLAGGVRSTSSAMATMNAAVRQQDAVLRAQQASMRASTLEGLNLSRQFTDVAVSAAMGMNPLMILIQQGPQIADVFQQAAAEGRNFNTVLSGLYARLAPILVPLAAIAAAAGAVAGGFGLLNRELQKGVPSDITTGLGLTEEQLKRVESRTVTFGDTVAATFTVVGRHIMDGPVGEGLNWLGDRFSETMDMIGRVVLSGAAIWSGIFVGAYRTVVEQWRNLPAAIGDAAITAANGVIQAVENMINAASRGLNRLLVGLDAYRMATGQAALNLRLPEAQLGEIENQWAGAGQRLGVAAAGNIVTAIAEQRANLLGLLDEIRDEAVARATRRALEEAGDANARRGRDGRSDAERQIEETLRYIQSLRDQAATLGLNAVEARQYEIAQRALAAPTAELRREVERYGAALIEKMRIEAADMRGKADELEMIELETRLVGATNRERAVAIAQLAEMQRLRNAGVDPGSDIGRSAVAAAGGLAGAAFDRDSAIERFNDNLRLTLDLARQSDDIMRRAARGFSEAFGDAGDAIGGVLTSISDLNARLAEIAERRDQLEREGMLTSGRAAELERERAATTIGAYGDMISAARGYFQEGSDGYKVLLAVEQAYRAYQLVSAIQAMAIGSQETALSVANSTAKGAASTAAGAAKMFEFLGPLGFPAVAAMIALLAGLGLSSAGGRGGSGRSSTAAANDNAESATDSVRAFTRQEAQSRDATLSSMAQRVQVQVTADREGLNAYVVRTARAEAAPMIAEGVAAGAEATRGQISGELQRGQIYSRVR